MELEIRVQIKKEVVNVLFHANAQWKEMDPSFFPSTMGK